jgi:hypothetical protein
MRLPVKSLALFFLLVVTALADRPGLQIINGTDYPVEVFWIKDDGARVPNGTVQPGQNTVIQTTIGHRFMVVGKEGEAPVVSKVPVQACRYGGVPPFYTQRVEAHGFPIVASAQVSPYALKEAAHLVDLMLAKRTDVRDAMIRSGARLCIMAHNEFSCDLPEFHWFAERPVLGFPDISGRDYWDARARGTGGSQSDPFVTCAEENLLGYRGDPYAAECILIHEFAHAIHLRGMTNVDPTFDGRLKQAYEAAVQAGLWKGAYASTNHHEYFAEGVQCWFDNNRENDNEHNWVNTRAELESYDATLASLCREVFGDTELRYTKPQTRLTDHLAGFDPTVAPRFTWPERLQRARAAISTRTAARKKAALE